MVNSLQLLKSSGKSVAEFGDLLSTSNDSLFAYFLNQDYDSVVRYFVENTVDVSSFNAYLFKKVALSEFDLLVKARLFNCLAENEIHFKNGADAIIVFVASLSELRKYFNESVSSEE